MKFTEVKRGRISENVFRKMSWVCHNSVKHWSYEPIELCILNSDFFTGIHKTWYITGAFRWCMSQYYFS